MTLLSRRAFATAALIPLLAGCGGHQGEQAPPSTGSAASRLSEPAVESARTPGRSTPVRLRISAIGVDTPVMPLGLEQDGTVQVPPIEEDDQAGWYRYSPAPGQVGPSVILGHVTVGDYGDGVFRRLPQLRRGDRITARLENGEAAVFTVREVRTVAKADFPTEDVYGNTDRPELRLITCGGPRSGGEYRDNVIVFAALSSSPR